MRMHLVTGGSASGKSAYAESLVLESGKTRRYYIATMRPWGEEGRQRIEKHRRMRKEKKFETIECYTALKQVQIEPDSVVLLECMSNLTANELFETGGCDEEILERIVSGVLHLREQAESVIIVTNEVFSDGGTYDSETLRYIRLLGQVNIRLAALADRVTEVVFGIPVPWR